MLPALLAALALAASPLPTSPVRPTSPRRPAAVAPAPDLLAADAAGEPAPARAGRFDDDWDGALAAAKARQRPILVEVWAPW